MYRPLTVSHFEGERWCWAGKPFVWRRVLSYRGRVVVPKKRGRG